VSELKKKHGLDNYPIGKINAVMLNLFKPLITMPNNTKGNQNNNNNTLNKLLKPTKELHNKPYTGSIVYTSTRLYRRSISWFYV